MRTYKNEPAPGSRSPSISSRTIGLPFPLHQTPLSLTSSGLESIEMSSRGKQSQGPSKNDSASTKAKGSRVHADENGEAGWKEVRSRVKVHKIEAKSLVPSTTAVNSNQDTLFLGSYSWQTSGPAKYKIPGACLRPPLDTWIGLTFSGADRVRTGCAPVWQQDVQHKLPMTLRRDNETRLRRTASAAVADYPFEPLFEATGNMSPEFRFDRVDIVAGRNSLRKLLDFCGDGSPDAFRLDLYLVHNTLLIERWERDVSRLTGSGPSEGYGHNFERACTRFPDGDKSSGRGAAAGHG